MGPLHITGVEFFAINPIEINLIPLFALASLPIIPDTAEKMLKAVGMPLSKRDWPEKSNFNGLDILPRGEKVNNPGPMFTRIDDEMLIKWNERFPGS